VAAAIKSKAKTRARKRKNASRPDAENPEWTAEDMRRARPVLEVLPKEVVEAIRRFRDRCHPSP